MKDYDLNEEEREAFDASEYGLDTSSSRINVSFDIDKIDEFSKPDNLIKFWGAINAAASKYGATVLQNSIYKPE